ncbi:sodium-coupled monocarboxylate transporter 1 [Anopheles gambiae]|uniref:sodium-coupled monocarboxylate transporter 1 n=1 Tax=Anopheles gambiae TaxID=7165 RepID=UPI002AC95EC5|nr:sodium-coupled monocarboxylate transporter 1 [Anopheles gambiae]XP_061500172.1 sodium-coupled monocarboxylate transporter 1 [Anopheles gambiae]XP_061500173.1 sodium-coupled monocarboxylate transporter 1 [Anopheles gambiae]XP_061500175.1 sodium-coupled monocarboxylate transporter 1 [Anopheles gambiae]XP_061500176.1 sodium-coupled monocarboxylate transporter 1 [Anopheles gambiae]XP_061500177.1 sodium-coupled monocarboxylate transporter 1 [Anopheles gambiae]
MASYCQYLLVVLLAGVALGQPESIRTEPTDDSRPTFTVYDYLAVAFMLVISIGIGVFYGWFEKRGSSGVDAAGGESSDDFLLGSGMSLFPVTLSLTTSFITAIELLGNPAEMFFSGTQFSLIVISMVLVVPVAVKVFYPIYYKLDVTSCYEYLGMRFDKRIRTFGAVLYILQMLFYTSVAVLAPAIALSEATGLNKYIAVVLIYFVCIFYSSQGGMKAVVIADTFQACVLLLSLILILALGTHYSAGLSDVFSRAAEHDRIEFFNFDPNPTTRHSVFSVIIGGFFYWTSMFCTNQASVQKCMSLKSLKTAKLALYFSLLGLIAVFLMNFYTGLMTFAHYSDCDPLAAGQITAPDQLLPFYVMDVFGHIKFMAGIFVAGIFAASLGTVAAALNSLAAVTCEDLLVSGMELKIPAGKGALYAKWMSLGFGLVSFGLVFVVERLGGILQATLTLNGLIGGVTLGLFSLGIFFRRANSKGAMIGGIVSLVLVIAVGVLAQLNNEPTAPLPSSVEGCNATLSLDGRLHSGGFAYDIEPADGAVSLALQHHVDDGTVTHLLSIATKDGWNGQGMEQNFYRLASEDAASSDASSDVSMLSTTTRQEDGSSSWFASVYQISYMWYSCLGTLLTVILGLLVSLLTSDEPSFGSCFSRSTTATESELPTTDANPSASSKKDSLQCVVVSGGEGKRTTAAKLSVGSMAPLALMMRTSVKLTPAGGARPLENDASIGSSQASIYSLGQQTVTSELDGSSTEEERGGLDRSMSSIPPTQSPMRVETERF